MQDVKREGLWVESPMILEHATGMILKYIHNAVDVITPAADCFDRLNTPEETIERSDSTTGTTDFEVKPEKKRAKRKARKGKRSK